MRYLKVILFLLFTFLLYQCEETLTGSSKTTYSIASVGFSEQVDHNNNGYASQAKFSFDVDVSKGSENVFVKIGYRSQGETGDYTLYFQSTAFTISGESSDDAKYIIVGDTANGEFSRGTYDFLLQVFKEGNESTVIAEAKSSTNSEMGNVRLETSAEDSPPTYMQFNNNVFTDIVVTLNNSISRTVAVGDSAVFEFNTNPGNVAIHAETSGKTNQGTQIGEKINWNAAFDMTGKDFQKFNLNIDQQYFFIYMTNSGTTDLGPIHVNYESSDQSEERIINVKIPMDGVTYSLGYFLYSQYGASRIAAFKYGSNEYVYWDLSSKGTLNQSWNLTNSLKKSAVSGNSSISVNAALEVPISGSFKSKSLFSNDAVSLLAD
jgi:hypothetical protein